jgi:tetratricopeptide (TPR) repeat protein
MSQDTQTAPQPLADTLASSAEDGVTRTLATNIGRFEITSKLGAGGMGIVMLATDPLLGRKVAIKILHDSRGSDDASKRRLLREAQAMAQLSHENVIVVHEVGEHEGQVYVAMEYVVGSTLTRWQTTRGWREILEMYTRAGRGLQAAHDAGLVHRDFKPDNVLVGDDNRLRVSDFGLVASGDSETRPLHGDTELSAELTQTGALLGTPRYMAPEQHLGELVDARADQFAFCVALYEALFGKPPFSGNTYDEISKSVLESEPPIPDGTDVPSNIRDAVLRGLRRNRDDRFPTMRDLLSALTSTPAAARRRWPLVTIGIGVVVAGLAATYVATRSNARSAAAPDAIASAAPTAPEEPSDLRRARLHDMQSAFNEGATEYMEGHYDAAASAFQRAYAIHEYPQFLFNAAASLHMQAKSLGDATSYAKAVELYKQYLSEDPQAIERGHIERTIEALDSEIAHIAKSGSTKPSPVVLELGDVPLRGVVVIETDPSGATIRVDQKKTPLGTTPWSGWLEGKHTVVIEKPGYLPIEMPTSIAPGKLFVVSAPLPAEKR